MAKSLKPLKASSFARIVSAHLLQTLGTQASPPRLPPHGFLTADSPMLRSPFVDVYTTRGELVFKLHVQYYTQNLYPHHPEEFSKIIVRAVMSNRFLGKLMATIWGTGGTSLSMERPATPPNKGAADHFKYMYGIHDFYVGSDCAVEYIRRFLEPFLLPMGRLWHAYMRDKLISQPSIVLSSSASEWQRSRQARSGSLLSTISTDSQATSTSTTSTSSSVTTSTSACTSLSSSLSSTRSKYSRTKPTASKLSSFFLSDVPASYTSSYTSRRSVGCGMLSAAERALFDNYLVHLPLCLPQPLSSSLLVKRHTSEKKNPKKSNKRRTPPANQRTKSGTRKVAPLPKSLARASDVPTCEPSSVTHKTIKCRQDPHGSKGKQVGRSEPESDPIIERGLKAVQLVMQYCLEHEPHLSVDGVSVCVR